MKRKKVWWDKKIQLLQIDKLLCDLMREYANTQLGKRKNGYWWLKKAKDKLEEL